jgi:hypothetical protein
MPGFGLIAALVASVAIVIGSSAPWVSALIFTANGTVGDGKLTLAIGLIAAVVLLFAAFGKMQAFSYILAIVAGLLAFAVGRTPPSTSCLRKASISSAPRSAPRSAGVCGWC